MNQDEVEESDEADESSESRSFGHEAMDTASSEESDPDGELPLELNTVHTAKLKLMYDVEYQAPE